jgi:hypothetical protein
MPIIGLSQIYTLLIGLYGFLAGLDWVRASQVFYNFFVGVAAGVLIVLPQIRRSRKIRSFRKQYPLQEQGKMWRLIAIPGFAPIYVHDLQKGLRHHVANGETFVDLHFDWNSVRPVSQEECDRIPLGDPINTEKKL